MINKLFCRFSSSAFKLLQNKVRTQEMNKIKDFCQFFDEVTTQSKEKKLNNIEEKLNQMQKFDIDFNNLQTLQWMYQNVFDHPSLNDAFNNLLGAQIILLIKGINSDLISREYLNSYVSYLNNYHIIMQFNIFYTTNLVQFLYSIQNKFGSLNNAEQRILHSACESYQYFIQHLYPNYISTQFYYLSQLNLSYYSIKHFLNIQILFTKRISQLLGDFNENQLKSIYYSLGKDGFYNNKIKDFLIKKIDENFEIKTDEQFISQVNLFLCATNLFNQIDIQSKLIQKINNILKVQNQFLETRQQYLVSLYQQILRCEIFDEHIWNNYFQIQSKIQDSYRKNFISYNLIQFKSKLSKSCQNYVEHNFESNKEIYLQKLCDTRSNSTKSMEKNIQLLFDELKLNYQNNIYIDQFEVDFYFPKQNLILEICGPVHYSFNIDATEGVPIKTFNTDQEQILHQSLNQTSLFKKKYLESLGYKVYYLNFMDQRYKNTQIQILEYLKSLK
ncbi:unnamed protein product [Paramecium pentaurelia]|uniref:RAP domain-containing protein n=1 Tax=Paramecium pentaurelia TaxID=43138 RepID=A0A8S1SSW4_9CILI|nr:unnamed protein product [Paramecium pentaurelia]